MIPGITEVPLVWGFERPHRLASVCGPGPCQQCNPGTVSTGVDGILINEPPPFFIVAEATKEDWRASAAARGSDMDNPLIDIPPNACFYFVRTD